MSINENGIASSCLDQHLDIQKSAIIDKKTKYADIADREEVERPFSLAKKCYGLGRIMTKPDFHQTLSMTPLKTFITF